MLHTTNFREYDLVYSPAILIDARRYPETRFMFGPHVSVFPDNRIRAICGLKNVVYIQPSEWARVVWVMSPLCDHLKIKTVPFAVDTVKFSPKRTSARSEVFIYFKRRHPMELDALCDFFESRGITPRVFDYVKKYDEYDYLNFLQTRAKYGVWLGSHESQGFALQEALSCNIPLLVWDATSMNQEHGGNLPDVEATSAPYWDGRCGEKFTMFHQLDNVFDVFIDNLGTYAPREYVLENLTVEKCEQRFIAAAAADH